MASTHTVWSSRESDQTAPRDSIVLFALLPSFGLALFAKRERV
jgi:hypothetical protein